MEPRQLRLPGFTRLWAWRVRRAASLIARSASGADAAIQSVPRRLAILAGSSAVAMVEIGPFDLQRAMLDPEPVVEHGAGRPQQVVGLLDIGRHQMGGDCRLGRAERPDMEIVHRFHPVELPKLDRDLVEVDALPARRQASCRPIRAAGPSCSTGSRQRRRGPSPDRPMTGRVCRITRPEKATAADTAASAVMCWNAPRRLRSCLLPPANINAVTPLTASPASATTMTIPPASAQGRTAGAPIRRRSRRPRPAAARR